MIYKFPDRLASAISAAGKTPNQLAAETGISRSTIYSYLNGSNTPSALYIGRIAACLKVPSDWLIGIQKCKDLEETK